MYFEVYVDSLVVLQFVMNCYLLALVNKMLHQTVSIGRVLCGAMGGAVLSIFPFLLPLKMFWCVGLSFFLSVVCMSVVTFRAYKKKSFLQVLEKIAVSTMLLGGGVIVLLRFLPGGENKFFKVTGILSAGGVIFIFLSRLIKRKKKNIDVCKVTLFGKEMVSVDALIDTGNGLVEPISGKPVAVVDRAIFEEVFGEEKPAVFRMIPYHSIGKRKGVLQGYLLDKIKVETEDGVREYRDIYIGISDNIISQSNSYKIILHPEFLK